MATYKTKINGVLGEVTAKTGDYRLAAAMAVAMADVESLPVLVTIWCEELLPEYGPYRYRVQNEPRFGWLVVTQA